MRGEGVQLSDNDIDPNLLMNFPNVDVLTL